MNGIGNHRVVGSLLSVVVLASCGDGTGPAATDLSGLYELLSETSTAVCTPGSASEILAPALGNLTVRIQVRVVQVGEQVSMDVEHVEGIDGRPVTFVSSGTLATPVAADGTVQFETHLSDHFTLDGRTFYDETTSATEGRFDAQLDPIHLTLSTSANQVFHEGELNAPVFASCTQTLSTSGVRIRA